MDDRKVLKYSPTVLSYLKRMIVQFEEGKLTENETLQLMQDLVDTGLAWSYGEEIGRLVNGLLQTDLLKPAESGYKGEEIKAFQVTTLSEMRRKLN